MSDFITLTGTVGTEPKRITTGEGVIISSFRLASDHRWFDRKTNTWVDGSTNWYGVSSYRQLAENVLQSVRKGDRVVVTGRLKVRDWESGDRRGTSVDVEAESIGHDLARGRSVYTRTTRNDDQARADAATSGSTDDAWPRSEAPTGADSDDQTGADAGAGWQGLPGAVTRAQQPADYASNLQQPLLPEDGGETAAS